MTTKSDAFTAVQKYKLALDAMAFDALLSLRHGLPINRALLTETQESQRQCLKACERFSDEEFTALFMSA